MNASGRIRFFFGIVFVILAVVGLAIYLNIQMSTAYSRKAIVEADTSSVGINYTGLVKKQYVEEGSTVKKDAPLFEIDSSVLKQDLSDKKVTAASLPFDLDPKTQNIILKANQDGVIRDINYQSGSFVPSGGVIATINTAASLHVVASFTLSPPDYARINRDSDVKIKLPDNSTAYADIFDVRLVNNNDVDSVDTVVKARLQNANVSDFLFSEGTPVQVELSLKRSAWYEGLFTYVQNLFKPQSQ